MKTVMIVSTDRYGTKKIEDFVLANGDLNKANNLAWRRLLQIVAFKIDDIIAENYGIKKLSIDGEAHQAQIERYKINSEDKCEIIYYELIIRDIEI